VSKRILQLCVLGLCLCTATAAFAHLCNDVFQQAKDNLAVKVDIRDGQLRIGKEASFRVYVLNTMDRGIADLQLGVKGEQFDAQVKASPEWRGFPSLRAVREGGKKEYYEVMLRRKPGVPDGHYKIELNLYSEQKKGQSFKTVDLESAAAISALPKSAQVKVDGMAGKEEWGAGPVCTEFCARERKPQKGAFEETVPAQDQSRVRVLCDKDNLYCLFAFQGGEGAAADVAAVHAAASPDARPVVVRMDRRRGSVDCDAGTEGIACKAGDGLVECKIPRKLLGIGDTKTFYLNFTRTVTRGNQKEVTYWRGNEYLLSDPTFYGQFTMPE